MADFDLHLFDYSTRSGPKLKSETITQAAIIWHAKIYTLPRPARHCDLIRLMRGDMRDDPGLGLPIESVATCNQAFVTSTGRWVDRKEAFKLAVDAKQPWMDGAPHVIGMLFSEDLW